LTAKLISSVIDSYLSIAVEDREDVGFSMLKCGLDHSKTAVAAVADGPQLNIATGAPSGISLSIPA
jgi:hypothetical protein